MVFRQDWPMPTLGDQAVAEILVQALGTLKLNGRRVLVIIPDGTRTAPIQLMYRLLQEQLSSRVARIDFLIALGTHKGRTLPKT
jgi:lactate racemase